MRSMQVRSALRSATLRDGLAAAAALLAAPRTAGACAVCSANANDPASGAFLNGTLFLSLLPVGMFLGILWWIRRRARQLAADEAAGVLRLPAQHKR